MAKRKTYLQKFNELEKQVEAELSYTVLNKGKKSHFSSDKAITIHDENLMYNLDGSRYLREIIIDNLVDNEGYRYSYHVLPLDELCNILDYCKTIKK